MIKSNGEKFEFFIHGVILFMETEKIGDDYSLILGGGVKFRDQIQFKSHPF